MLEFNHCKKNNETYLSHLVFAIKVGRKFLLSGIFFSLHSLLPFLTIPKRYNIDCMYEYIGKLKNHINERVTKRG